MSAATRATMGVRRNPHALHSLATLRIQTKLERWELDHLRALAADQAARIDELERELADAEDRAAYWSRSHHDLAEHLNDGSADARAIGLTKSGELLVVRTEITA